ncbi:MAG: Pycsar system effector family protein [Bacteroidota bacterium]
MTRHIPITKELLEASEAFSRKILEEQLSESYQYHTKEHTIQVVRAAEEIGIQTGLDQNQLMLIKMAAWFHDLGYINKYLGHEEESMAIAQKFLEEHQADEALIKRISDLIYATRLDVEPQNTLEEVLKDADLYNLSTERALENSEKIREEWKIFCDRTFEDDEWEEFNYRFFKDHEYYTVYAKHHLGPSKKANTKQIKKAIKKRQKLENIEEDPLVLQNKIDKREAKIEKLKKKLKQATTLRPDRGIETMFRATYRTHINLSDLADSKSNILLSVNAIIISIIFTNVFAPKESPAEYIIFPSIVLMVICMISIVFAILATRPSVNSGVFSREDILKKKTNLLFFGNFYRMELDDFMWGINEMMNDAEYLYGSMAKDIYFLGKVLAKKFQLLRVAYNIFMYGLGLALVVFAGSYIYFLTMTPQG